jgi:hypothetical protein
VADQDQPLDILRHWEVGVIEKEIVGFYQANFSLGQSLRSFGIGS